MGDSPPPLTIDEEPIHETSRLSIEDAKNELNGDDNTEDQSLEVTATKDDSADDTKLCAVCGGKASGVYFGALVCLPCKSFFIRCTKDGEPKYTCQCSTGRDVTKQGRTKCQFCRYQRCVNAGMCRKEKPEMVQITENQKLCKVCGDVANGIHFGIDTCEGCKKFFRRGLLENNSYVCKGQKNCTINPRNRNNCRYCRYVKCLEEGMSRNAIKMGRPKKSDTAETSSSEGGNLDIVNNDKIVVESGEKKVHLKSTTTSGDKPSSAVTSPLIAKSLNGPNYVPPFHLSDPPVHLSEPPVQQVIALSKPADLVSDLSLSKQTDFSLAKDAGKRTLTTDFSAENDISRSSEDKSNPEFFLTRNEDSTDSKCILKSLLAPPEQNTRHTSGHMTEANNQSTTAQEYHNPFYLQNSLSWKTSCGILVPQTKIKNISRNHHSSNFTTHVQSSDSFENHNQKWKEKTDATTLHGYEDDLDVDDVLDRLESDVQGKQQHCNIGQRKIQTEIHNGFNLQQNNFSGKSQVKQQESEWHDYSTMDVQTGLDSVSRDPNIYRWLSTQQSDTFHRQTTASEVHVHTGLDSVSRDPNIYRWLSTQQSDTFHRQTTASDVHVHTPKLIFDYNHQHFPIRTEVVPRIQTIHYAPETAQQHRYGSENYQRPVMDIHQKFGNETSHYIGKPMKEKIPQKDTTNRVPQMLGNTFPENLGYSGSYFNDKLSEREKHWQRQIVHTTSTPCRTTSTENSSIFEQHMDGFPVQILDGDKSLGANEYMIDDRRPSTQQTISPSPYKISNGTFNAQQISKVDCLPNSKRNQHDTQNIEKTRTGNIPNKTECTQQNVTSCNSEHTGRKGLSTKDGSFTPYVDPQSQMRINELFQDLQDIVDSDEAVNFLDAFCNKETNPDANFNDALVDPICSGINHEVSSIWSKGENSSNTSSKRKRNNECNEKKQDDFLWQRLSFRKNLICEKYNLKLSIDYWHRPVTFSGCGITNGHRQVMNNLLSEFNKFVSIMDESIQVLEDDRNSEPWPYRKNEEGHWNHVQRRIVRNTSAAIAFYASLPGFADMNMEDRKYILVLATFACSNITAAVKFFDVSTKTYKHFWNWTIKPDNVMYPLKLKLLEIGEEVHAQQMSQIEVASVAALMLFSSDFMDLKDTTAIENARARLIEVLQVHLVEEGKDPIGRVQELLFYVPKVRFISVWHKKLMSKMRVNMQLQGVRKMVENVHL